MKEFVRPTTYEVRNWLLGTLQHVCLVEYYLNALGCGHSDPNRPHDIIGPGSKFHWPVIKGLAVQYRNDDPKFFKKYVLPSIEAHQRNQYHHQQWNGSKPNPSAGIDDMKVGAIDSICSQLGYRPYQGGSHTFDQIEEIIEQNPEHKAKWLWMIHSDMKKVTMPNWRMINSLKNIPNIGLPDHVHKKIMAIVKKTVYRLKTKYGYTDL